MNTTSQTAAPANMSMMQKLLHMLSLTHERELTCAEVFELADYYVELQQKGENVQGLLPGVVQHLRICAECADEYEALLRMIGLELELG